MKNNCHFLRSLFFCYFGEMKSIFSLAPFKRPFFLFRINGPFFKGTLFCPFLIGLLPNKPSIKFYPRFINLLFSTKFISFTFSQGYSVSLYSIIHIIYYTDSDVFLPDSVEFADSWDFLHDSDVYAKIAEF